MGLSHEERKAGLLQSLQQASGRALQRTPDSEGNDWSYVLVFANRSLRCSIIGKNIKRCELGISLGQRPISLIFATRQSTVSGQPAVVTGDPSFDEVYRAHGVPEEVIGAALDPPMRQWLLKTYAGSEPWVETRGDYLRLLIPQNGYGNTGRRDDDERPNAEAMATWIQALFAIADGLCRAFDERHAMLVRTQGEQAAKAWVDRARSMKAGTAWVVAPNAALVVIAIVLGLLLVVGAVVTALWFFFRPS